VNTKAVTKAKITRAIATLEAMGKTVGGIELSPDGTVRLLVGAPLASAPLSPEDELDRELREFRQANGYG
jgi:hypothetical protein